MEAIIQLLKTLAISLGQEIWRKIKQDISRLIAEKVTSVAEYIATKIREFFSAAGNAQSGAAFRTKAA